MNVALRLRMTTEEFLAWEESQPERWEFDGFRPVAMAGGTVNHNVITGGIFAAIREQLRGSPCRAHIEGMKIEVDGSIRYPDVFVACGPASGKATVADNPVVVFEVLSPSTVNTDVIVKSREYRATASIMRYVLVAQDRIAIEVHTRRGEDWVVTSIVDPDALLEMPEIGVSIPIASFYEGVSFEP